MTYQPFTSSLNSANDFGAENENENNKILIRTQPIFQMKRIELIIYFNLHVCLQLITDHHKMVWQKERKFVYTVYL